MREPKRIERNLDYFYTINSDSSDYIHHTLHLEEYNDDYSLKKDYFFDLRKYLDVLGYDYFSNFFNKSFIYCDIFNFDKYKKLYNANCVFRVLFWCIDISAAMICFGSCYTRQYISLST